MNYISEKKHQLIRQLMTEIGLSNYKSVEYNPFFKKYYIKMADDRLLILTKKIMDISIYGMKEKNEQV